MKTKVNSFVQQFKAELKGDNVGAIAEKAWRQANSALNAQIHILNGKTVGLENEVDDAKDALRKARVNGGQPLHNTDTYIENLLDAKNVVTKAEKELKHHEIKINFLKLELEELSKEVKEEEE